MVTTTRLLEIFGADVVLMAFSTKQKGPRNPGWQRSQKESFSDLDSNEVDAGLANCGILLRDGLGCIDLDDDAARDQFFDLNPDMAEAFAVRGTKGCKIFVRWADGYPQGGQKIKNRAGVEIAEILGDLKNATVAGIHPSGTPYH